MTLFSSPIVLAALVVILILHVISPLLPHGIARPLAYVNIVLHIALILPLIYFDFDLEEAVLIYMISLFTYTSTGFVCQKISERKGGFTDTSHEESTSAEEGEK